MTDRRSTHFYAFAAALVMTLSIFSGVSHLYAPTQSNAVLAQGSTTIAAHS